MADTISSEARSKNMSRIRSCDTKPEIYLRKRLFSEGYRYRKNVSNIIGHPDLFFPKYKTVIFVHGCFWHHHPRCRYAYNPKSREDFWKDKFIRNAERDSFVKTEILKSDLQYMVVWECTVKRMMKSEEYSKEVVSLIRKFLTSDEEREFSI